MEVPGSSDFEPVVHTGGTLHHFAPSLTAYEHSPTTSSSSSTSLPIHTLIFLPGLYCTLLSTSYATILARSLPASWRLVQPTLSSSGQSFGTGSLDTDVAETALLVAHVRKLRPEGKVVLLGHSTGCQDSLHYVVGKGREARPKVDGIALQAPASDREALAMLVPKEDLDAANSLAAEFVSDGRGEDVLPRKATSVFGPAPMSARRWLSLTSPDGKGQDDYFSSDLGGAKWRETFGRLGGVRLLVMVMGNDEFVPEEVDKEKLVGEWKEAVERGEGTWDQEGGVLEGGDHELKKCGNGVVREFVERVMLFLGRVEGPA